MSKPSKRFLSNAAKITPQKRYEVGEALTLLKSLAPAKFDESVDVAVKLGVDPKKSEQMVRGVVRLPHGTGRTVRILVFAKGEKEQEARAAGADFVGAEDLVEKIKTGWLEFDKVIATPDMMPKVGPIAKILGPRGLMPNPKLGTVTVDVARAVGEEKAGRIEFRVDKAGIVHAPIGKLSYPEKNLAENLQAVMEAIDKQKPTTQKGKYLQTMNLASTMSPGIKVDVKTQSSEEKE